MINRLQAIANANNLNRQQNSSIFPGMTTIPNMQNPHEGIQEQVHNRTMIHHFQTIANANCLARQQDSSKSDDPENAQGNHPDMS